MSSRNFRGSDRMASAYSTPDSPMGQPPAIRTRGRRRLLVTRARRRLPSSVWPIACVSSESHNLAWRQPISNSCVLHRDHALSCREAGVEPLTLDALQRLIAALTDTPQPTIPAGDVWVTNNWQDPRARYGEPDEPISTRCGGQGVVVFFGMAKPVHTPQIGPARPASSVGRANAIRRAPPTLPAMPADASVLLNDRLIAFRTAASERSG